MELVINRGMLLPMIEDWHIPCAMHLMVSTRVLQYNFIMGPKCQSIANLVCPESMNDITTVFL